MPTTKYPNGRPCRCGCGLPAARNVTAGGRFKGWYRYAEGHQPPRPFCSPEVREKGRKRRAARLPFGSRRKRNAGRGRWYWEVKVEGRAKWMLEHRHIMELRLGRRLLTSEHVHHRDNDGLNNGAHADGESNLELLTASEHTKRTYRENPPKVTKCKCPCCGQTHFKKL